MEFFKSFQKERPEEESQEERPAQPPDDGCWNCAWWVAPEVDNQPGDCRRFPPVSSHGTGDMFKNFPKTRPEDWCGERKPGGS